MARGNVHEQEMVFNQEDTLSELNEHVQEQEKSSTQEETSERHVLSPRANRGVPPKTYSPKKVSRGSRYPSVGHRWVFTIKYKPDGTIERYKARLVAKGYTQTYGIDYSETFSPVAKINAIRVLCFVAANKGWPLHQFDVKNAFLHGKLKEEVYMESPHGFTNKFREREVCLLKKSLYGLKQSPRAWFGRFTLAMKNHEFKQSNSDHTLFLKQRGNLITCLIIYVDDMIATGDDKEEITKLKKYLFTEFEMKDLGRLKYFRGIEVLRSKQGIFMCQKRYILDLLAETGMIDCKPSDTPMIVNQKLYMEEKAVLADKGRYQRMVRKLIYLSHTRPDIEYVVGVVSQFMHQPQKNHIKAVMRILRYLKGSTGHGVLFKPNGHLVNQMYTDADWAGDKGNRRSTSGYFTIVGGNLVTWRSKKQKVVSLSSTEAEFRGIARGLTEVLWVRRLLTEIEYPPQEASKIMSDNKAAIQISENPVQHDRTKHVEVDRHFIKEKLEAEIITLPFVRSEDQLADILTKSVNERALHKCLDKLNFGDPTIQLEREC
ncbi:putative RNA-directed DNA polymerase [Tanacetum coccineum]